MHHRTIRRDPTTEIRKLLIILTLLGATVVLAACGSYSANETSTVDVADPSAVAASDDEPIVDSEPITRGVFAADAPILTGSFIPLDPGTYRVDRLGTSFSFEIDGEWSIQRNEPAFMVLSHPDSYGPDDRDVVFLRPRGLAHPSNPTVSADEEEWWDLDDIDGWIEETAQTVQITNQQSLSFGDRSAERFDVALAPDFGCDPDHPGCLGFAEAMSTSGKSFEKASTYRIYWVEDDFEPIAIIVGDTQGGTEWFAVADAFLSTVAFGESLPHPSPLGSDECLAGFPCEALAGTLVVPAAGGLSMELAEPRRIYQENGLMAVTLDGPGAVAMFAVVSDGEGNPLGTYVEVVDYLVANGLTISDVAIDIPFDATALDVAGAGGEVLLMWDESRPFAVGRFGRVWVLDTPRGPIFVMADTNQADVEEAVIALAEAILPTLQLVELGE